MTEVMDEFGSNPGFIFLDKIEDIKWHANIHDYFEINPKFRDHALLRRWCEENCKDEVIYCILHTSDIRDSVDKLSQRNISLSDRIYFFRKEDMVAFKLRWADAII